jgi:hypothetical protein
MDQTIRNHSKIILHLPMSIPKGLLHCSKIDGALCIPKLEPLAKSTALKQSITLLNSLDKAIQALLKETKLEKRLKNLARQ